MGGKGTLHVMIGIGMGAVNFATGGSFFVASSFISSGDQKKEYSGSDFEGRDVGDVVIFFGKVISFTISASGIQKKERSETNFVRGVTGDEMNFVEGAIQSDFTCCIGDSCDGTDVVVIFLMGKAFKETTS